MPSAERRQCPICGAPGVALAVSFECDNPQCRNHRRPRPFDEAEVRGLLQCLWEIHGVDESLDQFIARFFEAGGRVERDPTHPEIEHAVIVEPDWLRERMS